MSVDLTRHVKLALRSFPVYVIDEVSVMNALEIPGDIGEDQIIDRVYLYANGHGWIAEFGDWCPEPGADCRGWSFRPLPD